MARPKGHTLNPEAWDDVLRLTGRTLTEVADRADVPRSTLSSLLGGHHAASVTHVHRIASALGVHPSTIFPTMRPTLAAVEATG